MQPPPTLPEVGSIHELRRDSALMICWAEALCDQILTETEKALLASYAEALRIAPDRVAELKQSAQFYLLEKTLELAFGDLKMTIEEEDQVIKVGLSLGLTLTEVQDAIGRFRRRRGLS